MRLAPGARLGSYEILSLLGAGGMGEVYRARDTRLNHDIALKVLLEREAADPQRRAGLPARPRTSPRSIIPTSSRSFRWRRPTALHS
jgi:eukaryotic-like serine/threonine-protein kinase